MPFSPFPLRAAPAAEGHAESAPACPGDERHRQWAAHGAAERIRAEFNEFGPDAALDGDSPLLFTGEMIYPWMFGTGPVLRPLRAAAEELAAREHWPRLHDAPLAASGAPAAAAVYYEDMYVPVQFSMPTARGHRGPAPLDHQQVPARTACGPATARSSTGSSRWPVSAFDPAIFNMPGPVQFPDEATIWT